jgi:ATP-dependent DNA ligase
LEESTGIVARIGKTPPTPGQHTRRGSPGPAWPEWTFELKFDGFRAIADTVNGRMLWKRGNRMHRFEALLGALPPDPLLDGEIVALDETGRPVFADLMFRRQLPIFVAFDVLVDRGADVCAMQHPARDHAPAKACCGTQSSEPVSTRRTCLSPTFRSSSPLKFRSGLRMTMPLKSNGRNSSAMNSPPRPS